MKSTRTPCAKMVAVPDINKKVQTGDGINNDVDTKTDGTTPVTLQNSQ